MQGIEANMTESEMSSAEDTADVATKAEDERATLTRAVREFDVAKARIEQHAERVYDEKRRGLVLELLPVLDNLDRSLAATKPTSDAALVEGVRIVRAELEGVLIRYGVERVDAVGQRFDPKLHEAVAAVPVQDRALVGTVVSQSAPGYRFGDRVLRAAKVSVGVQSTLIPSPAPSRARPMKVEPAIFARLRRG
jgi:molecular chaperone GrpE (heat shock protein)